MIFSVILGYAGGVLEVVTCIVVIAACIKYLKTK